MKLKTQQKKYMKDRFRGTWLARSVQHETRDFRVVSSSPTLDVEVT